MIIVLILASITLLCYDKKSPLLLDSEGVFLFLLSSPLLFLLGRRILKSGPRIIISDRGIEDLELFKECLPWESITGIKLKENKNHQSFLQLQLRPESEFLRKLPFGQKQLIRREATEPNVVLIPVHRLEMLPEEFHQLVKKCFVEKAGLAQVEEYALAAAVSMDRERSDVKKPSFKNAACFIALLMVLTVLLLFE